MQINVNRNAAGAVEGFYRSEVEFGKLVKTNIKKFTIISKRNTISSPHWLRFVRNKLRTAFATKKCTSPDLKQFVCTECIFAIVCILNKQNHFDHTCDYCRSHRINCDFPPLFVSHQCTTIIICRTIIAVRLQWKYNRLDCLS